MILVCGLIEYSCYAYDLGIGVLGQCNSSRILIVAGIANHIKSSFDCGLNIFQLKPQEHAWALVRLTKQWLIALGQGAFTASFGSMQS